MKRSLLLLPLFLAAGAASAQVTDPYDVHVGDIGMLQDKRIQADVGITAAQRTKMQAAAAAHTKRLQEYQKQLQVLGQTTPDRARLMGYLNTLKSDVFAVLTPAQGHRLSQLTLQRLGLIAALDPIVGKKIGITAAQKKGIEAAFTAGKTKFQATQATARDAILAPYKNRKPKDQAEAASWQKVVQAKMQSEGKRLQPQLEAIGKQTDAAMLAVLTPAERAAWTALKGKTFVAK